MIQAYRAENTDYTHNGDMTLTPSSAVLTAAINDTWTVQLEHPIDNMGRWKYVSNGAVIKLPSFNGEQLFRVKETERRIRGSQQYWNPSLWMLWTTASCWMCPPPGKTDRRRWI